MQHKVLSGLIVSLMSLCASLTLFGCASISEVDENKSIHEGIHEGVRENAHKDEDDYYREHFDANRKSLYDTFLMSSENPFADEILNLQSEDGSDLVVSIEEANSAYQGFLYDHPEIFWMGGSFQYRRQQNESGEYDDSMIDGIKAVPISGSVTELEEQKEEFEKTANQILKLVPSEGSDKETARFLHDWLAENVVYREEAVYDTSLTDEHTAYGALVSGEAVCDGYALAYKYLLSKRGIECVALPGLAAGTAHVWNLVYWDGEWHEVDVTWDARQESAGSEQYFDLTTDQMSADHEREEEGIAVLAPIAE